MELHKERKECGCYLIEKVRYCDHEDVSFRQLAACVGHRAAECFDEGWCYEHHPQREAERQHQRQLKKKRAKVHARQERLA